jgi:hypothetical protein
MWAKRLREGRTLGRHPPGRQQTISLISSCRNKRGLSLEATQEAQDHIETEIACAADFQFARRKQALQIMNSKLVKPYSHIAASRRNRNDLSSLYQFDERNQLFIINPDF